MYKNRKVEDILIRKSKEIDIPLKVIKAIFESQFHCAKENIKKANPEDLDSFVNIRFRHLGLLIANPLKIKKIQEANDSKKNI